MGTDKSLILSSLPKSVTMPVAMSVSEQVGGVPSLTATFVVIAGITGTITGPLLLKWSRVTNSVGKGIGFGCASHIMGVMRAMKITSMKVLLDGNNDINSNFDMFTWTVICDDVYVIEEKRERLYSSRFSIEFMLQLQ